MVCNEVDAKTLAETKSSPERETKKHHSITTEKTERHPSSVTNCTRNLPQGVIVYECVGIEVDALLAIASSLLHSLKQFDQPMFAKSGGEIIVVATAHHSVSWI